MSLGTWEVIPALAQNRGWTTPVPISSSSEIAWNPAIVADTEGQVHVVWTSDPTRTQGNRGDSVLYAKWSNGSWSEPNSILLSPKGRTSTPEIAIDKRGWMHVIWESGGGFNRGPLYYSRAPVAEANSARGWTPPVLLATEAVWGDIEVSQSDVIYVVYADHSKSAIMLLVSRDNGESWEQPITIYEDTSLTGQEDLSRPRLAIGPQGDLHVGWIQDAYNAERPYSGRVLFYASSQDRGATWTKALMVDSVANPDYGEKTPAEWINLAVDSKDRVHLVWDGANGYRYHQWSADGGLSWSEPTIILPEIGYAGWNALAVDSADVLHVVASTVNGLFSVRWQGGTWSSPEKMPSLGGPHFPALAVSQGSTLFLVYQGHGGEDPSRALGMIISQRLKVESPTLKPVPVPTVKFWQAVPVYTRTPTLTPVASPTLVISRTQLPFPDSSPGAPEANSSVPLLWGVLPVMILIGSVIFYRLYWSSARNGG